jgi:arsenate reductase-like glutaredoxin family protein
MKKAFEKNLQNFLTQAKEVSLLNTEAGRECKDLAGKYNVPFMNDGKADAKCPGIMNPLGEQPKIEFQWGNPSHNEDRHMRWNEFRKALKAYDNFVTNNESFKTDFLNLKVHGRVMFDNIAKVNNNQEALKAIAPLAQEGLNMDEVPFGKGSAKVSDIFGHYIASDIAPYIKAAEEVQTENKTFETIVAEDKKEVSESKTAPQVTIKKTPPTSEDILKAVQEGRAPEEIKLMVEEHQKFKTAQQVKSQQTVEELIEKLADIKLNPNNNNVIKLSEVRPLAQEELKAIEKGLINHEPELSAKFVHATMDFLNEQNLIGHTNPNDSDHFGQ